MAEFEKSVYKYNALKHADSIRLLELLPGHKGTPLFCKLIDARKNQLLEYEALSYAWGDAVFTKAISDATSSAVIRITENLHEALQILRSEDASRVLWIDAICINQSDLREKSHQVELVGEVFRDAMRVLVWLGGRDCTKTLEILNDIASRAEFVEPGNDVSYSAAEIQRWTTRLLAMRFFEQSWFSRVWVVPEFVLAREIQLIAGDHIVDFEGLRKAVHNLNSLIDDDHVWKRPSRKNDNERLRKQINRTSYLFACREIRLSHGRNRQSLLQCVLDLSRGRECSNKRDYIYALLGLAGDEVCITPDYNLPVRQVWSDFAVRCLLAGETSILHESGFQPGRDADEPSFVPVMTFGGNRTLRLDNLSSKFGAGTMFPVNVKDLSNGNISMTGIQVDTVIQVAEFTTKEILIREPGTIPGAFERRYYVSVKYLRFRDWILGCERKVDWDKSRSISLEFFRDLHKLYSPKPYSDLLLFDCFLRLITLDIENYAMYQKAVGFLPFHNQVLSIVRYSLQNRVLFKTRKGYLGLGSRWMKQGDSVVIFDGGKTPFILRHHSTDVHTRDKIWKLVGDCYLLGWMYGDYFGHQVVDEIPSKPNDEGQEHGADSKFLARTSFILC